ncbi:MAG: hypothetical protein JXA21_00420 [Anaerolineae bacterium]|nr:hypothetical protein [Anaerolineae bacterium]
MSEAVQYKPVKKTHWTRRIILYAVLPLVAFLLGLVPMWWKSRECSSRLPEVERQLSLARQQSALASAAIDAQRGDYELARQAASDFFTYVRVETDSGDASTLSPAQREGLLPLLARRDEIITLLARGDPASADQLSDLYVAYRTGFGIK